MQAAISLRSSSFSLWVTALEEGYSTSRFFMKQKSSFSSDHFSD